MAWVKLDDGFFRHDKARAAGKDGRSLFVASLCYAADRRSDGFIAEGHLSILCAEADVRLATVKRLLEVGLWEKVADGYQVHDYLDYQPSADEVEKRRQMRAEAGSKGGKRAAATRANRQASATAKPKQTASKRATPLPTDASTKHELPAEASPSAEDAKNLVTAFWETSNPKPSVKFVALLKLAERFLDAGWTQQQLMKGLRQTRAFTVDAIEFTLRQAAEPPRQTRQEENVANLQGWIEKGGKPDLFALGGGGAA